MSGPTAIFPLCWLRYYKHQSMMTHKTSGTYVMDTTEDFTDYSPAQVQLVVQGLSEGRGQELSNISTWNYRPGVPLSSCLLYDSSPLLIGQEMETDYWWAAEHREISLKTSIWYGCRIFSCLWDFQVSRYSLDFVTGVSGFQCYPPANTVECARRTGPLVVPHGQGPKMDGVIE